MSAQHLEPGQGGICRVARLTVKALADIAEINALAVEDRDSHTIAGVRSVPFKGNRLAFFLANARDIHRGQHMIYDFAGTARAQAASLWRRSPSMVWVHGYDLWGPPRPDYVRTVKAADIVLANSHYTLERVQRCVGAIPQAQVCWLATEEDEPPPAPPAMDGPPTVLFVGRSDELFGKGQDLLVEAWPAVVSKIPDARLLLAGGGPRFDRLRNLVRQSPAQANIDLRSFVPEDEIDAIWRGATVFAMLGSDEGFGLVLIEAMRHGLPVIASTDDASREVNADGVSGFNVPRGDTGALAERIVFLLSDRDRAAGYGRAGQARWREHFRFSGFKGRLRTLLRPWLEQP